MGAVCEGEAMTQAERVARDEECVRDWFKDHVATRTTFTAPDGETVEHLLWSKPGTGINRIYYYAFRRRGGYELLATGDLGTATYFWGMPALARGQSMFDWIGGCNLDYFAGKCESSEFGRRYETFDKDLARESFIEAMREHHDGDAKPVAASRLERAADDCEAALDECNETMWGPWHEWLRENGYDLLGSDWHEFSSLFGMVIALRCRGHLVGLKLATEQLRAGMGR